LGDTGGVVFCGKSTKKKHKKCFSSPFFTIFAGENEKN